MIPRNVRSIAIAKWAFACTVALLLLAAEPALAQRPRGGGRSGGRSRPSVSQRDATKGAVNPGTHYGRILKFEPVEAKSEDEFGPEVLGMLKIKPVEKGVKTLLLAVPKSDELRVTLAGHVFESEAVPDLLWKGLYCSADWVFDPTDTKKTPTKKQLTSLTIDVFDVEGEIVAIEDDHIVLKARPTNSQEWRHLPAKDDSRSSRASDKPKAVRSLKLKLKILDEITKFTDAADHELDSAAFEVGQSVTASIAYGSKMGILAQLRSLTIDEDAAEAAAEAGKTSGGDGGRGVRTGPEPRGGDGARPRGGAGAGPRPRGGARPRR